MLEPLLAGGQSPPPPTADWPVAVAFVAFVASIVVLRDLRKRLAKRNGGFSSSVGAEYASTSPEHQRGLS